LSPQGWHGAGIDRLLSSRIGKTGFSGGGAGYRQEGFVSLPLEPLTLVGQSELPLPCFALLETTVGDQFYDAVSLKGFIEKGEEVIVKRYENFQLT
jgi:membrane-bound serine protease (ClpP class)